MTRAPAHEIAAIIAAAIASAADSRPEGEVEESDVIDVALWCAHGGLTEAFGEVAADRICGDERTRMLCGALLRWHWATGGAL